MVWLQSLLPALIAGLVTMLLTPAARRLALRLRALDVPGGRKQHGGVVPRLGGLAIVIGAIVALVPCIALLAPRTMSRLSLSEAVGFAVAVLIVFGVGLVDDIRGMRAYHKLLLQLLAAGIVVGMGWQFEALRLPLEVGRLDLGALAPVLSILWLVGVTNAINFIDGLDGLAAGVVAIIASSLLVLALLQGVPESVVATSAVVGACVGFLRHNWRPASIYMGDSGSLTLGFVLAAVTLHSSTKASALLAILVPLLALGLPVIDTLLVIWYRFLRGHPTMNRLARVFHGDRKHLHHLLLDNIQSRRSRVMLTLYGLAVAFCVMALVVAASASLRLALAFLAIEVGVVVLMRQAGLRSAARRLSVERVRGLETPPEDEAVGLDFADRAPAPLANGGGGAGSAAE